MLNIKENHPLKDYTSFGIGGNADFFVCVKNTQELKEAIAFAHEKDLDIFILGGGCNLLVSDRGIKGLVIKLESKGIKKIFENQESVVIQAASGELWDDICEFAALNNWWGIENLSHIPSSVGACAVQNIGAYGQEVSDVIKEIEVYNKQTEKIEILSKKDCDFGYRKSIFNTTKKGQYIILSVTFELFKNTKSILEYPDLFNYFKQKNNDHPTAKQIRDAVIEIRSKKLPDIKIEGSAGCFFKNVILSDSEYDKLHEKIEKEFSQEIHEKLLNIKRKFSFEDKVKIPTAFLIDMCNLKGLQVGGASISQNHALIIINKTGNATAKDVMALFKKVRQTIYNTFGIEIINEPELIGFPDHELEKYFSLD